MGGGGPGTVPPFPRAPAAPIEPFRPAGRCPGAERLTVPTLVEAGPVGLGAATVEGTQVNPGILSTLREGGLIDVPDEELIARVEARLPKYLMSRAVARSPFAIAAVARSPFAIAAAALIAIAALQGGTTEPTGASPSATTSTTVPAAGLSTASPPSVLDSPMPSFAIDYFAPLPADEATEVVKPITNSDTDGEVPTPAPVNCDAQPLLDTTGPLLSALKEAVGVVPGASTQILLANLAGCAPGDPPILLLGILVELGNSLPDPGFELPAPPLPYVELPQPLLDALAPAWPALEPVCTNAGLLPLIAMAGLEPYPGGLDDVSLSGINQVINVCSQLAPR
jgi:hypothetical protein